MKEKVNEMVRLHWTMQEKLKVASYSEQIQLLTFVPDKWSRIYCSKSLNIKKVYLNIKKNISETCS